MSLIGKGAAKVVGKGLGLGGVIGVGMNIIDPVMQYRTGVKEGKSKFRSGVEAVGNAVAWQVAAPVMVGGMVYDVGNALAEAGSVIGKRNREYTSKAYEHNFGGSYVDTQRAATMRQMGMNNMAASRENVRSSLGGEAKQFYRRDMR